MAKYDDYQEIVLLLKGKEWGAWVKFLKERYEYLKSKVLTQVKDNDMESAKKTAAVAEDVLKQIDLFLSRRNALENELDKSKEA